MKTDFNGSEFSADLKAELDNINKGIATTIGAKSIENLHRPNSNNAATRNGYVGTGQNLDVFQSNKNPIT